MDAFISRKRRRLSPLPATRSAHPRPILPLNDEEEEDSTDVKLAILSSLHPNRSHDDLLEILLSCDGSVETALEILATAPPDDLSPRKKKPPATIGVQSALPYFSKDQSNGLARKPVLQPLTKKGRTLHLYTPEDVAAHTPCSIVHNFLPTELANALLHEILPEVPSYKSATFKLFDNVVQSPHTACFYVSTALEQSVQKEEYLYNGSYLEDVRELLPVMRRVSNLVRDAVNDEIKLRIATHYPEGKKLKYQSPLEWQPNAAFVNCYDGAAQNVGYHSDQLTYLGPRAVIGSLSLGVVREFRVRKIVPKDDDQSVDNTGIDLNIDDNKNNIDKAKDKSTLTAADISGQIAIHLPHNSLLVMHAEMQEEWKHSIAPAQSIDPHPLAGNKRINITYRWYRAELHPKLTPHCRCGVPTVLKCVQRQRGNRGRYMWMCQVGSRASNKDDGGGGSSSGGGVEEGKGCGFFEWAEFTDDGVPVWKHRKQPSASKEDGKVFKAPVIPKGASERDNKSHLDSEQLDRPGIVGRQGGLGADEDK